MFGCTFDASAAREMLRQVTKASLIPQRRVAGEAESGRDKVNGQVHRFSFFPHTTRPSVV